MVHVDAGYHPLSGDIVHLRCEVPSPSVEMSRLPKRCTDILEGAQSDILDSNTYLKLTYLRSLQFRVLVSQVLKHRRASRLIELLFRFKMKQTASNLR